MFWETTLSLLAAAMEKYAHAEVPVRDVKSPVSEPKKPRPTQSELQEVAGGDRADEPIVRIDWGESPLVQSVDKRSKELRESPDELQQAAADDWSEVSNDPAQLVAFADSLAIVQIRKSGGVPDTYVSVTTCQNCGPVPIWPGCPPRVKECPWCMNGLTAPAIPGVKE